MDFCRHSLARFAGALPRSRAPRSPPRRRSPLHPALGGSLTAAVLAAAAANFQKIFQIFLAVVVGDFLAGLDPAQCHHNGARGYSKDTIAGWVYRAARIVDGADEVHKMVLAKFMRQEGRDFWLWSAGNRV
jgi:uncharacterized MAPEG superfamily protein